MVKQNKKLRNEAEWQDIRIRKSSLKQLALLKVNLDKNTYDEVIQYLLSRK